MVLRGCIAVLISTCVIILLTSLVELAILSWDQELQALVHAVGPHDYHACACAASAPLAIGRFGHRRLAAVGALQPIKNAEHALRFELPLITLVAGQTVKQYL